MVFLLPVVTALRIGPRCCSRAAARLQSSSQGASAPASGRGCRRPWSSSA